MAGNVELQNLQIQRVIANMAAGVGYGNLFIAEQALPLVNTYSENFIYSVWGNEALADVMTKRAIGAETNTVAISASTVKAELDEHAISDKIDYRQIKAAQEGRPTIDRNGLSNEDRLRLAYALTMRYNVQIQKEKEAATVVFGAGNYGANTAAGVSFSAAGVRDLVLAQIDGVAQRAGVRPNVLVLGQTARRKLFKNPDIVLAIQYGGNYNNPAVPDETTIAKYLGLEKILVGNAATQLAALPGASGTPTLLWTTDSAALYYADFANSDVVTPSFAKMFYMDVPETGSRVGLTSWTSLNGKLYFQEYTEFFRPSTVFTTSGYLWTGVI